MSQAKRIRISGLVQGVGFRPFIRRLAIEHSLAGWVDNRPDGVYVHAEGKSDSINEFIRQIAIRKPAASSIYSIEQLETYIEGLTDFEILRSSEGSGGSEITEVSPDIAVCEECLADMQSQPHRINYPFINCTNCGPRFSIIRELPYDREKTTMAAFEMCPVCQEEYRNIDDRRYHAQPVACNHCGPEYSFRTQMTSTNRLQEILSELRIILSDGGTVAIKGLGGYNLMCDASREDAVLKLRKLKNRDSKPFAVMFASDEALGRYAKPSVEELIQLKSWQRPIVILESRDGLAKSVSNGFPTIGAMLPYMPMQHLIFRYCGVDALVMTSGNISDEPIIIDDDAASALLAPGLDAILSHNREIHNRCDDSVMRIIGDSPTFIRRSRSFAPAPMRLGLSLEGIFAAGAELSNCFAIGRGNQAIFSQYIGDLKNIETLEFYEETFDRFSRLFRFRPALAACDLHPDYLSTRFASSLEIPLLQFQHHHAHIAACMAENEHYEPVIGLAFDGSGLGTDGNIWGSEFLVCDLRGFQRISHFEYVPLPGGDKAVEQPWRIALSYLMLYYGNQGKEIFRRYFGNEIVADEYLNLLTNSITGRINTPLSSGAGRLFDAVAALTGICTSPGFHAEAPMRLEAAASREPEKPWHINTGSVINLIPLFDGILNDLEAGISNKVIARRFHESIADLIFRQTLEISALHGIRTVALSGGVFQNKLLSELLIPMLKLEGLNILRQRCTSPGDGGIALGQLALAASAQTIKT